MQDQMSIGSLKAALGRSVGTCNFFRQSSHINSFKFVHFSGHAETKSIWLQLKSLMVISAGCARKTSADFAQTFQLAPA